MSVREIILESARSDSVPHNHRLKMALEEAAEFGLDLVLPCLRERLDFIRAGGAARYAGSLPDELQPLLYERRGRKTAQRELERLLDELEDKTTIGLYRMAVEEAVDWLGTDSTAVTHRLAKWVRGSGRHLELAYRYVHSGSWRTFTTRARLLLDAQGDSADVCEALVADRFPRMFIGSLEPYFRGRADDYRRWLKHHDKRLRKIAAEAIAKYEHLAQDAAERERRDQEEI